MVNMPAISSLMFAVVLLAAALTCIPPVACGDVLPDVTAALPPTKNGDAPQPPQHYIQFGRCYHTLQKQRFGNWVMTRPRSSQKGPESLVLYLDTRNTTPVASAFGTVQPLHFPLAHIYFAYWNKTGVKGWSTKLDKTNYKEVPSYYWIKVNGKPVMTIRDMKDSGPNEPITSYYSLKGSLGGSIKPSVSPHKIEIYKICDDKRSCDAIPNPATVFTSPTGHIVWSIWSVHQPLTINGTRVDNHAWCPVETVIDVQ